MSSVSTPAALPGQSFAGPVPVPVHPSVLLARRDRVQSAAETLLDGLSLPVVSLICRSDGAWVMAPSADALAEWLKELGSGSVSRRLVDGMELWLLRVLVPGTDVPLTVYVTVPPGELVPSELEAAAGLAVAA